MNPMSPAPMSVPLERLRHAPDEALLACDFDSQAALDDQTRWWHNRAVHNTYGIVEGLEAISVEDAVVVLPGLAYDSFGRELMLDAPWQDAVPVADEPLVVVIARAAGSPRTCAPAPHGYCRDVRLPESTVAVRWQTLASFTPADGVVVATVPPMQPVHERDRIYTRVLARPRIGHGATVPGGTAWTPWTEVRDGREWFLGLEVQVDTSAAGFTTAPCYFAQLTGSMWDPRVARLFIVQFQHIALPDKDHFTYRLLAPWLFQASRETSTNTRAASYLPNFASAIRGYTNLTGLAVTWTGIQRIGAAYARRSSTRIGGHSAVH